MTLITFLIASEKLLTREVFGNIPPAARLIFYIVAGMAVAFFVYGLLCRVRLWRLGQKTERSTTGRMSWRFVRDVLWQRRLPGRGAASVAHVLLFWGFVVLLIGTTLIAIEHLLADLLGREPTDPVFHQGFYFAVFEVVMDAAGLALIAGCAYFLFRRWRRPASLGHDRWDWVVLAALIIIGVTGYMIEGLRIIREQTPSAGFSFVGFTCAKIWTAGGVDPENVSTIHRWVWWVHAIASLAFIGAMPFSRLRHALAGVLLLGTRDERMGRMSLVEMELVEETGRVGVGRIVDFQKGQLLALDACVSCGRCQDACPAHEAGKPLSPRDVVQDLRSLLNSTGSNLLAGELDEADETVLVNNAISDETLWSCTTCSACQDVCPLGISPVGMITDMRRHVVAEGRLRGAPATALQKTDRSGNPWGLPSGDRMAWAEGIDVPTVQANPHFDVLYWVGCAAAYDRRVQKTARSIVTLLHAAHVNFAVLGNQERCNGETARRMGDEFLFQQLAADNVATLESHNVRKILTHCPHCLNSFRNDYPQLGGKWEVVHHSQFLAELVDQGKLPAARQAATASGGVTYHDPCYLARVNDITQEPRQLVSLSVSGDDSLVEMPRHGRQTACCGAGGGRMWVDDAADQRVGQTRLDEAIATGAKTVAVSCPFCMVMLRDGLAARDVTVEVKDIAELLVDALHLGEQGRPAAPQQT